MLSWLLLHWRKLRAWLMPGPTVPVHHDLDSRPYQASNLHARHYR